MDTHLAAAQRAAHLVDTHLIDAQRAAHLAADRTGAPSLSQSHGVLALNLRSGRQLGDQIASERVGRVDPAVERHQERVESAFLPRRSAQARVEGSDAR